MADKSISGDDVIGRTAKVKFLNFPHPVMGLVDTGAEISSLHAKNIETNRSTKRVSFECEPLSHNVISTTLEGMHAVQSANGVENRPIVKFDIEIHGKIIKGVLFNLTDRAGMDEHVLIGENALKSGHFLINPAQNESVSNDKEIVAETEKTVLNPIETVYNLIIENDIKLIDLLNFAENKK